MNPGALDPLTIEEAEELAGAVTTSSTIERYVRSVRRSAAVRRLTTELRTLELDSGHLLDLAWRLRGRLLEEPRRSEWELPLAAIVACLGDSGVKGTEELLQALATSRAVQAAWIAGLCREILAVRTSSHVQRAPLEAPLPAHNSIVARDRVSILYRFAQDLYGTRVTNTVGFKVVQTPAFLEVA